MGIEVLAANIGIYFIFKKILKENAKFSLKPNNFL
jgi:hypothetical protein